MRSAFLLVILLLVGQASFSAQASENVKTIKSKLNEATVFLQGAELIHTATVGLKVGHNDLKMEIDQLSPDFNRFTARIEATDVENIKIGQLLIDRDENNRIRYYLELSCFVESAITTQFRFIYFTASAKWDICYGMNIESLDEKTIDLEIKGKLRQTTTFDWTEVNLTFSTAPSFFKRIGRSRSDGFYLYQDSAKMYHYGFFITREYLEYLDNKLREGAEEGVVYIVNEKEVSRKEYLKTDLESIVDVKVLTPEKAQSIYGKKAKKGSIEIEVVKSYTFSQPLENREPTYLNPYLDLKLENPNPPVYELAELYTIKGDGSIYEFELQNKVIDVDFKIYIDITRNSYGSLVAQPSDPKLLNLSQGFCTVRGVLESKFFIKDSYLEPEFNFQLRLDFDLECENELLDNGPSKDETKNIYFTRRKITLTNKKTKPVDIVFVHYRPLSSSYVVEYAWAESVQQEGILNNESSRIYEDRLNANETKVYDLYVNHIYY